MKHFYNSSIRSLFMSIITTGWLLFLPGCSLIDDLMGPAAPPQRVPGRITRNSDPAEGGPARIEGVEVTWQVPSEPVDGFIIRYGYDRNALGTENKVALSQLRTESDPEFGPVYRFVIPGIKAQSTVFVSVAAYRGDRVSDFSDTIQESTKQSAVQPKMQH